MDGLEQVMDWQDRRGRTWFVAFDVDVHEGVEVYRGVRLRSGDEETQLTSAVARAFADALGTLKERDARMRRAFWHDLRDERAGRARGPRPGPKRKYESAEVRRLFRQAQKQGQAPGRAVAKAFGVSPSYASRLIARAVREGYDLKGGQ